MGLKAVGRAVKERARQTFNVPANSGDYASETIVFGGVAAGVVAEDLAGVTVLMEAVQGPGATVPLCQAEVWLPRVPASDKAMSDLVLADWYHSGQVVAPVGVASAPAGMTVSFGSLTYALAGYPGVMIRVKSGGVAGSVTVSATAF